MKSLLYKDNIHLINQLKFKPKGKVDKINLEEKMKKKDNYLRSQLIYLSSNSKYIKELERLKIENKNMIKLLKKKSEISIKKEIKNINNNQRILKGASNKMFLDIIFNNEEFKNYILSNKNKNKEKNKDKNFSNESKPNIKLKTIKYEICDIDNIQINSIKKKRNKFKHSISSFYSNIDNIKLKNNFPNIKTYSENNKKSFHKTKKKNTLNIQKYGISNLGSDRYKYSENLLNSFYNYKRKKDEIKGMLTINYNIYKRNKNNLKNYISKF